ncbi:MAG: hypothetical protein KF914_03840 [Rhizobiaceae bacterium]|nr:hypothetical protein [Rhizobiaceae bacterium]
MEVEAYIESWIELNISEGDTLAELEARNGELLSELAEAGLYTDDMASEVEELSRSMVAARLRTQSADGDYATYFNPDASSASGKDGGDEDEPIRED